MRPAPPPVPPAPHPIPSHKGEGAAQGQRCTDPSKTSACSKCLPPPSWGRAGVGGLHSASRTGGRI